MQKFQNLGIYKTNNTKLGLVNVEVNLKSGLEVIKLFFMLSTAKNKIYPADVC